jgi:Ran GTPase-activating protein (RanGAP) involved in mRNA processing and transport
MSSNSLKDTQLFFKSILKSRIKNPSKYKEYSNKFSLNFLNYDLYDEDINKITQLIVDTEKMTSLSIRLSDTLQDKNILNKLLRKISLKKQFTSLSFYIKYLKDDLLNIFIEFIGKLENTLNSLEINIKYNDPKKETDVLKNILLSLINNTNSGITDINFNKCRFNTEENISLLNNFLQKNKYKIKNLSINIKKIYNDIFTPDISKLKKVELNYCNISSILYLPIETLNLANNNIGILGLENITNKLKNKFCTLKNLNLSHNYIGNEGCFMIGESFKENKSLIDINLSENNILDEGAIYLANNLRNEINKTIKKINLKNNSITSEGIIQFCSILKNEPIERFEKINFSLNDLDDTGLSDYSLFISRFQNITSLLLSNNFSKTSLNNYFIYCQNLSNLKKIKFYQINLTEESSHNFTQILLNNKNIEKLSISSNRNLHDGIFDITQGIEHNIKLTYLNLKTCFIGDRGAEALASALFKNIFIKEIDLEDNKIGTDGIKFLSEKVLGKISLVKINLAHNLINEEGSSFLGNSLLTANALEYLELGSNLLKDDGCINIGKGLVNNLIIKSLGLNNNMITNKGADELCKYLINKENLFYLGLSSNEITEINEDFTKLFEWLKIIKIADNPLYPSAIINIFQSTAKNRLFKQIRFKCNDKYLFKAINSNENLKIFDLSYNDNLNINLLKNIIGLKNISKIYLQRNNINDNDIQRISQYIQEFSSHLKELYLQSNLIGIKGSEYLAELIKNNHYLKVLYLTDNPLQSKGVINICNSITNNYNEITELSISNTKCNDYSIEKIINMLKKNKKIKDFNAIENKFTNKGVDKILAILRNNNTLLHISIGSKYINYSAFDNLGHYLSFNKTLLSIEINSSKITDNIIIKLAKMLLINKTLSYINIRNNLITREGLMTLGQYLNKNKSIKEIMALLNVERNEESIIKCCNPHIIFN